jgi:hypothetical protein
VKLGYLCGVLQVSEVLEELCLTSKPCFVSEVKESPQLLEGERGQVEREREVVKGGRGRWLREGEGGGWRKREGVERGSGWRGMVRRE